MTKADVEKLLRQKMPPGWPSIWRPKCIQPLLKGGLSKDGPLIAKLWFDEAHVDIEDLPVVARIIDYTRQKKRCAPSQVLLGLTVLVRDIALKYQQVLEAYGIRLVFRTGGLSLEAQ